MHLELKMVKIYQNVSMIAFIGLLVGNMATKDASASGDQESQTSMPSQYNSTWNPSVSGTWNPSTNDNWNYTWTPSPTPDYNYTWNPSVSGAWNSSTDDNGNYTWTPSPTPDYNYTWNPSTSGTWNPSTSGTWNPSSYTTSMPNSFAPSAYPTTVLSPIPEEIKIGTGAAIGLSALGLGLFLFHRRRRNNNAKLEKENKEGKMDVETPDDKNNGKPLLASSLTGMAMQVIEVDTSPSALVINGSDQSGGKLESKA